MSEDAGRGLATVITATAFGGPEVLSVGVDGRIVPASGVGRSTGSSVGMRGGSSSLCEGRKSNRAATAARAPAMSSTTIEATPVLRAWLPDPPSSVFSIGTPVNSRTMWGPLTKA